MILSGEKKEEYRDIKLHWARQLLFRIYGPPNFNQHYQWAWINLIDGDYECQGWNIATGGAPIFKEFDTITFSNGYSKDRDSFVIELKDIEIKEGNPKWGAVPGEKYFCLKLGNILSLNNIENKTIANV